MEAGDALDLNCAINFVAKGSIDGLVTHALVAGGAGRWVKRNDHYLR